MPELFVVQPKGLRTPERWRGWSSINDDVVNRAVCTTHELCFSFARAAVQAAHHPEPRARLRILQERIGVEALTGRDPRIESTREEAAVVVVRRWNEHKDTGDGSSTNLHRPIVPLRLSLEVPGG